MTFKPRRIRELDSKQLQRFWSQVNKTTSCWEWTGKNSCGYGRFSLHHKEFKAHRVSWFIANRKDPEKLIVMHSCDNRSCVNPSHLILGTHQKNTQDAILRNRFPVTRKRPIGIKHGSNGFCYQGHKLEGENLYVSPKRNVRRCVECHRIRQRKYSREIYHRMAA